jgi:hypothetical protein
MIKRHLFKQMSETKTRVCDVTKNVFKHGDEAGVLKKSDTNGMKAAPSSISMNCTRYSRKKYRHEIKRFQHHHQKELATI